MGNEVGRQPGASAGEERILPRLLRRSGGILASGGGVGCDGDNNEHKTFRQLYMLQGRIGTGSHSQVFRAVERATGREVAVKAVNTDTGGWLDRDRRHLAFLREEISVHQEVSGHPFVVDLLGVFEDPEACYIVEELAHGGSLLDHLHSRASMGTEGEVRLLLRRLLEACGFLHRRRIVHRDIKLVVEGKASLLAEPENILVMDNGVMHSGKLADFGFALRLDPSPPPMIAVGTPEYIAPEVLLQQPFDGRADVWSAGVTAFCLLSGALPFRGLTLDKLYTAVLDGACSYAGSEWRGVSAPAQDLVRRMLVVDPAQRWTAGELLEHPWLTGTEGMMVTTLGLGRRGRVRLKALVLAVVFVQRLRRGLGRPWPSQQELGGP
ncbi:myosin light chain kinase [Ectocarpus siliculosus]|uniref:Myosin light chain kinase n=1 Tax=Ectocarpus siliculosus TaxID=2880 RepID=D8LF59_ECTSI|nr:myosin light chain kinase [Ectocarpus siliculosus]|eukprot:CBN78657.1 myosin light chain kinase [Ectocarpus siliculosus]